MEKYKLTRFETNNLDKEEVIKWWFKKIKIKMMQIVVRLIGHIKEIISNKYEIDDFDNIEETSPETFECCFYKYLLLNQKLWKN